MLKGLCTEYVPFATFSAVASTPSTLSAFTESLRDPSEIYPIALLSPETAVITSLVL